VSFPAFPDLAPFMKKLFSLGLFLIVLNLENAFDYLFEVW